MQVSWIEADDIKALLARIAAPLETPAVAPEPPLEMKAPPLVSEAAGQFMLSELEELPEEQRVESCEESPQEACLLPLETASPAPELALPAPKSAVSHDEHEVLPDHAAALPLSRIRDKLRAIRQRANEAGILAKAADTFRSPVVTPVTAQAVDVAPAPAASGLPSFESP